MVCAATSRLQCTRKAEKRAAFGAKHFGLFLMVGTEENFVDFLTCAWAACFQFVPAWMDENVVYIVKTVMAEKMLESKATE